MNITCACKEQVFMPKFSQRRKTSKNHVPLCTLIIIICAYVSDRFQMYNLYYIVFSLVFKGKIHKMFSVGQTIMLF